MTISVDGPSVSASQSSTTIVLTGLSTSAGPGNIVVGIHSNSTSIVSVVASGTGSAGLTFTQRNSYTGGAGYTLGAIWTAPYTAAFSGTITITLATSTAGRATAAAFAGTPTTSQFDSGGPQQNSGTGAPSITTTNANDVVYTVANTSATATAGSGWTALGTPGGGQIMEYQIVSATGTFTTTVTGATLQGTIIDAMIQGSAGAAAVLSLTMTGVGA